MAFHAPFKLHLGLLIWMRFPYTSGLFLSVFWQPVNPLSPSIHIQILQTDLYTFP